MSQIVLGATKIDLLGHTIKLEFSRGASVSNIDPANSLIDIAAIYEHVDATLASESNLWYIPDYFERIMLFSIHLVVLTVLEEVQQLRYAPIYPSIHHQSMPRYHLRDYCC